jgi:uncharacterized delta-60 repeat protein
MGRERAVPAPLGQTIGGHEAPASAGHSACRSRNGRRLAGLDLLGPRPDPYRCGSGNSNAPVTVHPFRDGAGRSQSSDPRRSPGPQLAGEAPWIRGHRRRPLSPLCSAGDTTFDGDGTATIDFGSLADLAAGAALQPDGRIVVAGYTQAAEDVAVARLNANGSPDATFGAAGKATVDFGVATFGNAVALAPNKRIVVAGQKSGVDNFAVARLRG